MVYLLNVENKKTAHKSMKSLIEKIKSISYYERILEHNEITEKQLKSFIEKEIKEWEIATLLRHFCTVEQINLY